MLHSQAEQRPIEKAWFFPFVPQGECYHLHIIDVGVTR